MKQLKIIGLILALNLTGQVFGADAEAHIPAAYIEPVNGDIALEGLIENPDYVQPEQAIEKIRTLFPISALREIRKDDLIAELRTIVRPGSFDRRPHVRAIRRYFDRNVHLLRQGTDEEQQRASEMERVVACWINGSGLRNPEYINPNDDHDLPTLPGGV